MLFLGPKPGPMNADLKNLGQPALSRLCLPLGRAGLRRSRRPPVERSALSVAIGSFTSPSGAASPMVVYNSYS
jgi:hypothetical protein